MSREHARKIISAFLGNIALQHTHTTRFYHVFAKKIHMATHVELQFCFFFPCKFCFARVNIVFLFYTCKSGLIWFCTWLHMATHPQLFLRAPVAWHAIFHSQGGRRGSMLDTSYRYVLQINRSTHISNYCSSSPGFGIVTKFLM